MDLMDRLRAAKAAIHDVDNAHPDCPHAATLHRRAVRLIHLVAPALGLSQAQLDELTMPQGGGTPKTPPGEGEGGG